MGNYAKSKGRSFRKGESFVMLRFDMIKSPAWLSLSCPARALWIEVMGRFKGYNNGEIPLSCREAAKLCGISKATASRAFDELIEKGFIEVGEHSSFTVKYKKARKWFVTHLDSEARPATNVWKKWVDPNTKI